MCFIVWNKTASIEPDQANQFLGTCPVRGQYLTMLLFLSSFLAVISNTLAVVVMCLLCSTLYCLQDDQGIYMQKVRDMIANNEIRLIVNINDLRRKNPARATAYETSLPILH